MTARERPILFSAPSHAYGADGFWSRADSSGGPDACWLWLGAKNPKGYGRRNHRGKMRLAHGVAYELSGRVVPAGHSIDHLCRNRACVNPAHLDAVPHRTNLLRGDTIIARAAAATHCPSGHAYDDANTGRNRSKRVCKACGRARNNAKYHHRSTSRSRGWLSEAEKALLKTLVADGLSHAQIAKRCNVSVATVSRVRNS